MRLALADGKDVKDDGSEFDLKKTRLEDDDKPYAHLTDTKRGAIIRKHPY